MKKCLFLIGVLCTLFLGCKTNFQPEPCNGKIVLGKKIDNPFSLQNMRTVDNEEIIPNYYYYKIRTTNVEKLELLINEVGELSEIPLDYEVKYGGTEYDGNIQEDNYTKWYYLATKIDVYDNLDQDFEKILLDKMYVPESFINEFENDCETEYSESEINSNSRIAWVNLKKCKPKGRVTVYDQDKGVYVPVPNVKVRVSQWCFYKETRTDSNGNFYIDTNFSTFLQDTMHFKVYFDNNTDRVFLAGSPTLAYYTASDQNIRGFSSYDIKITGDKDAQYARVLLAAKKYRDYAELDGVTIPGNLKFWCNNISASGVTLMQEAVAANLNFYGVFIGILASIPGAITGSLIASLTSTYLPDIYIGTSEVYDDNGNLVLTSTQTVNRLVFHEMAHASHFEGLGKDKIDYWITEYFTQIAAWCDVLFIKGKSLSSNCYDDGDFELINYIESWGNFYELYLNYRYYNELYEEFLVKGYQNQELLNYINKLYNYLEIAGFYNDSVDGKFYFDAYYDLIDGIGNDSYVKYIKEYVEGENNRSECIDYNNYFNDNVSGYTVAQIFDIYKSCKVKSKDDWLFSFFQKNNIDEVNKSEIYDLFKKAERIEFVRK